MEHIYIMDHDKDCIFHGTMENNEELQDYLYRMGFGSDTVSVMVTQQEQTIIELDG